MTDQPADRLAADYLAAEPNRGSSRAIVRALSLKYGLSEPKARSLLVTAGVYRAMPKEKNHVESGDHAALIAFFDRKEARRGLIKQAAEHFGYNQAAIFKFRMDNDLPVLSLREVSFRQSERKAGQARRQRRAQLQECGEVIAAECGSSMLESNAEADMLAMSPEPGFFSHPLWPLHLIVMLVVSTLVAVVLRFIFPALASLE